MNRPCIVCGTPSPNTRCERHARDYDRTRRPPPVVRYGLGYQRRHRETIEAEPWCHYPGGCTYPITARNPLTAQHVHAASLGGSLGPLVPWCKRHNSGAGNR